VDSLCVGYRPLFDDFKRFAADRVPAERSALFHDNAVRIYRIGVGPERTAPAAG
jgi:predicted TIM-barrel fold metal-dependent hydrolase